MSISPYSVRPDLLRAEPDVPQGGRPGRERSPGACEERSLLPTFCAHATVVDGSHLQEDPCRQAVRDSPGQGACQEDGLRDENSATTASTGRHALLADPCHRSTGIGRYHRIYQTAL